MKQLKFISILLIIFTGFNFTETSAQNWRVSLTTDYDIPFNSKKRDYWVAEPGYEGASFLVSRTDQKASFALLTDYHFFPKNSLSFYIGTGIGYKNFETSTESIAPSENAYIFSLSNVLIPFNIGLDIRPSNKLNINLSLTYEQQLALNNSWQDVHYSDKQLRDRTYISGEIPENISSVHFSTQNKGAITLGLNMGFDINVYKNYRLLLGAGVGGATYRFDLVQGAYYFHPITGVPDISGSSTFVNKESSSYSFLNLKAGIAKTF